MAERKWALFVERQYAPGFSASANSVPPTQVTCCDAQRMFVLFGSPGVGAESRLAQPATPASPDATNTEMPSAAAWPKNWSSDCATARLLSASHEVKLMLSTFAGTGSVSTA